MDKATVSWLVFALACAVIEIATPAFGFILVAGAAACAAAVCAAGYGMAVQLSVFAVVSVLSLTFLRSIILRKLGGSPGVPSRTDRLIGRTARVTEAIDPVTGNGRVIVDGHDWAAQSTAAVAAGEEVRVEGADGIRLSVRKI